MLPRSRLAPFGLFLASALLFAFSLLNMSVRSSSAQLDPTAQQETANAIVAQMFAATQTAQAGSATQTPTPTSTSTPTPTPTATATENVEEVVQVITHFTVSPSAYLQWEYLLVSRCTGTGGSEYWMIESNEPVDELLRSTINAADTKRDSMFAVVQVAGLYGWEFMYATWLFGARYFPDGTGTGSSFSMGSTSCFVMLPFRRQIPVAAR
jgi:hypothetical protein